MRKNRIYTAEFKIEVVRKIIDEHIGIKAMSKEHGITSSLIRDWLKRYQEYGETYFYEEHRGNHKGNPYAALHRSKNLSKEERLELENIKLRIENERLKKDI